MLKPYDYDEAIERMEAMHETINRLRPKANGWVKMDRMLNRCLDRLGVCQKILLSEGYFMYGAGI